MEGIDGINGLEGIDGMMKKSISLFALVVFIVLLWCNLKIKNMGRPTRVYPSKLHLFDKLHTTKAKMYAGVELTVLHCIKETSQFFISISSWCFCASSFKKLKYGFKLKQELPEVVEEDTKEFLDRHAWHNYVDKHKEGGDMVEAVAFINRVFPNKKPVFFYELKNIISDFTHGNFLEYDKEGNIMKPDKHSIKVRKRKTYEYQGRASRSDIETPKNIKALWDVYNKQVKEKKVSKETTKQSFQLAYYAEQDYLYKHHDLTDVFVDIGKNAIVTPYIFSDPTVKGFTYEHAGDIFMVVTNDKVYFQVERHF